MPGFFVCLLISLKVQSKNSDFFFFFFSLFLVCLGDVCDNSNKFVHLTIGIKFSAKAACV